MIETQTLSMQFLSARIKQKLLVQEKATYKELLRPINSQNNFTQNSAPENRPHLHCSLMNDTPGAVQHGHPEDKPTCKTGYLTQQHPCSQY